MRVLVNPGHGFYQKGKRSPELPFDHPLKERIMREDKQRKFVLPEWWTNREIVRHIVSANYPDGLDVVSVVPNSENVGQYLNERVKIGNKMKGDLWIGVHSDAVGDGSFSLARGHHVFYATAKKEAEILNKHMGLLFPGEKNRGVHPNPSRAYPTRFWELHGTNCPAILSENFFFTSELDCKLILDNIGVIAAAHTNMILEWYSGLQVE